MSELEDVFGEDFAQNVQERTAERRQERNQLTEEQMAEIAHLSINEGKFEEGDPQFTYTTDAGVTSSILLMQVPDPDNSEVWTHLSEPWEGAAKLPLDYLGQWYWSVFPDKKDVAEIQQGDHVIVSGAIEENEGDNGETYYNIYPVRGIMKLNEAKEMAAEFSGDADFEEDEDTDSDFEESADDEESEEAESDDDEEETSDDSDSGLDFDSDDGDSGGGLDGLMGDDEEEEEEEEEEDEEEVVPYEEIAATVEKLADNQDPEEEPQVYEIDEGTEQHKRLSKVVANKLDIDNLEGVADVVIDVIDEHREEEEEEEDETNKLF